MKIFHQTGHNYVWNVDSFEKDGCGDGLILSPVNIPYDKFAEISNETKSKSIFDPQFYRPGDNKGKLATYPFFPGNIRNGFSSSDFQAWGNEIAKQCTDFQLENNFQAIVIPTKYTDVPGHYYGQLSEQIVIPFIEYYRSVKADKKLFLTVIVKAPELMDDELRDQLLNWITGFQDIHGVYIIFENEFTTKQIKDSGYLINVLNLITLLKLNGLEIHIGYNGIEGILYSVANPDSVSMGSYENLKNFNIERFDTQDKKQIYPPTPRVYFASLYQAIVYGYIDALKRSYPKWNEIFDDTQYKPLMFEKEFKWHFTNPVLYKHYFTLFHRQVQSLPNETDKRIAFLASSFKRAIEIFKEIQSEGVLLDDDSNDSHLYIWYSVLMTYKKTLEENQSRV